MFRKYTWEHCVFDIKMVSKNTFQNYFPTKVSKNSFERSSFWIFLHTILSSFTVNSLFWFNFVNILSNYNNFKFTLITRVLDLLPLKPFRLLRGFLWPPLQLTPGKDVRLCTMSIECYVTNYKAQHTLYFQWKSFKNNMCKTL